jgi:predicted dinucleotide-binding enzyme
MLGWRGCAPVNSASREGDPVNIGVLGTGVVGQTIATKLVALGHDVMMGSRDAANPTAVSWATHAHNARSGSFADAAAYAALIVNATAGVNSLAALEAAGAANLHGKVLLDLSNPLDFSVDGPPSLSVGNTDSLGESIQRAFPTARVVKVFNTVTASVMTAPESVPGDHVVFMAGDDLHAKAITMGLLDEIGWPEARIVDLGGISAARGMEAYLLLWVSISRVTGTPAFNVVIAKA